MFDPLTYVLMLIPLILAAILVYLYLTKLEGWTFGKTSPPHYTVVKQDWVPTGRIDFAPPHAIRSEDMEQPNAFRLLVEERRIVESIAGNENLEIQWRLASLQEAKVVISQYHKYLSDNSLIKSVFDVPPSPSPSVVQIKPSDVAAAATSSQARRIER